MSFSWARAATALRKLVGEDAAKPREEQHLDEVNKMLRKPGAIEPFAE